MKRQNSDLRIGILGAGSIIGRIFPGVKSAKGVNFVAIAGRTVANVERIAAAFKLEAVSSCRELLKRDDIDAVYIALPESEHLRWIQRAAQAGKHVICEKTLVPNFAGVEAALRACKRKQVRLLEGFMYHFSPDTLALKKRVAKLQPRLIKVHFSFLMSDFSNYRMNRAQGGGALNDIGCYGISLARLLAGREPRDVAAHFRFGGVDRVDLGGYVKLDFGDRLRAEITFGFDRAWSEYVEVFGKKGSIYHARPFTGDKLAHRLEFEGFTRALWEPSYQLYDFEQEALCQAKVMHQARRFF